MSTGEQSIPTDVKQFAKGFNARPSLMFDVLKILTTRNDVLIQQEAELAEAVRHAQELEDAQVAHRYAQELERNSGSSS
ncbi:hypothetical protein K3495_g7624 [Podosphaera aphanis]|nr:hypothetical protein K3495_g7624 [Podosphaera aphanis]